jgi:hypothetical protein
LQLAGIEYEPYHGATQSLYGLTLHHFQIGGEFDILPGHVRPFLGFALGAAFFVTRAGPADELWFETAFEGGVKVMVTQDLGLRAQAQVTSIFMDVSSQIFCGKGCYVPWYGTGIGTTQLSFALGPVMAF